MPDVTVNVDVYCGRCGDGLCNQTTYKENYTGRDKAFHVEPCEKCLDAAKDEGDDKGYTRGLDDGREEAELDDG